MRLTPDQIQAIRFAATQAFGEDAGVWLFGSSIPLRRPWIMS
jgi:hypothetical protein